MVVKRGVKIYDFSIDEDRKNVTSIFDMLLMMGNLVPIIGSGFTSGLRTKNGKVPSVNELMTEMVSIIRTIDGSDGTEFKDISLTDLADVFWEELEQVQSPRHRERFQDYIESNFTQIYDVEQSRRHFLNSNWRTIFTLNYDDTIENVLSISIAIPYDRFNNRTGKSYLIKLHGDAKRYVITGDSKYCVLGNKQYVTLIKDKSNEDFARVLENAFFSKSIIFVGCSLGSELDLLYSAETQVEQKAKINKEHHIIYLLYSNETEEINPLPYKKYGITDIIKVNQKSIIDLYELIHTLSKEKEVLRKKDLLKNYTDISFEYLDSKNEENLEYLFYNRKIDVKNNTIKFPAFFVNRNCGKRIEKAILNEKETLNVVFGTRFSGKTYVLLQLLKSLTSKRVYYFPSYIQLDDEVITSLAERENSVFLIDDSVISFEQYGSVLLPLLDTFKEKNIKIVMAVNKGDVEFYKYFNNNINEGCIKLYEIANKFEGKETEAFNEKIGDISLIPYKENDTILDFLYKADENILKKKYNTILPRVNFLSNDCEKKVRALIVLATKGTLTSDLAINMGIDDVLYELVNEFSITVQKDYLSDLEKNQGAYSGFKFILNSTYWAVRCLSSFAGNPHNHQTIVKAYGNIVNTYSGLERHEMNNRIKTYYMLDRIQVLFADPDSKGTIRLPYLIYEELHTSLNWNHQFLHQEAKCELRMARREKRPEARKEILELSYRNIGRALKISEEINSEKVEYTKAHMRVTKALILINYTLSGENERSLDTISACHDAFVLGESLCPQLEKEELQDVKKFLESNWVKNIEIDEAVKDKFDELYSKYIRKPSWAKSNT